MDATHKSGRRFRQHRATHTDHRSVAFLWQFPQGKLPAVRALRPGEYRSEQRLLETTDPCESQHSGSTRHNPAVHPECCSRLHNQRRMPVLGAADWGLDRACSFFVVQPTCGGNAKQFRREIIHGFRCERSLCCRNRCELRLPGKCGHEKTSQPVRWRPVERSELPATGCEVVGSGSTDMKCWNISWCMIMVYRMKRPKSRV